MEFFSNIHGRLEYEEENIINLQKSLPGFEGLKKFIIVDLKEYEPFKLFQSLECEEVALIVISPFDFFNSYEINIDEKTVKSLKITDEKDVSVFTTVTVNSDPKKTTTNLKAPIIVNKQNGFGKQIIIDDSKYKVKKLLMEEL